MKADREEHTPHLVYEARKMLMERAAKYADPKNLNWEWEDAAKWERHAINAVLDLEAAESALRDIIAEADQSNGGKGAQLPIVLHIRSLAESALQKAKGR